MRKEKRSFFERITGRGHREEEEPRMKSRGEDDMAEEGHREAELSMDVYQTPTEIIATSMIAGVKPEHLDISITRDMIIIKAKREEPDAPEKEKYIHKELYWGPFGRTVILPEEIDADASEAVEKHGLLIIKMPKINKNRSKNLKVKSL